MSLPPATIKSLEQTRQRLDQLTRSLLSLQQTLQQPYPDPSSLPSHAAILSNSLTSLTTILHHPDSPLTALAAHPLPSFPASQEGLLLQLLRKKLERSTEEWVDAGMLAGREVALVNNDDGDDGGSGGKGGDGEKGEERGKALREMWEWAPGEANRVARGWSWGGEEEEDEEDEEEDGDDEEEGAEGVERMEVDDDDDDIEGGKGRRKKKQEEEGKGKTVMMGVDQVLRYMVSGRLPVVMP